MKRAELFHPVVFNDQEWAEGYYKRNAKNIERVGKRLAEILKKSGFKSGKILDAGCGFAAVPIALARTFPEAVITGIDLGEPLLELGRSLVEKTGFQERITLMEGDVQNMDFDDEEFDVSVNTFMLHVVDDPVKMLNETERTTRKDGKIMITDLRRFWLGLFVKKLKTALTIPEACEIIKKSDLRPGTASKGPFCWDYMAGF